MTSDFYITKRDGQVINLQRLDRAVEALEDGTHHIIIESAKKRSNQQNRYFHGVVVPMVFDGLRAAGFEEVKTKEDAKTVIKGLFLKRTTVSHTTGDIIDIVKDTHALTREEMNILIEDVIRWAAQYLNVQIAYPNEQLTIE